MIYEGKQKIWRDYQKEIPDDHWYYVRSCIRQNFFPASERMFTEITQKNLGRDVYETPYHTTCGGIAYHCDTIPQETAMTIVARQFALMTEAGYENYVPSCVTSFGNYVEILETWHEFPELEARIREQLWKGRERPKRVRRWRRAKYKIAQRVVFLAVEAIDVHQLLRKRIAAQLGTVREDPPGKPRPDARQGVEGGGIGAVQVQPRDVDEALQPAIDGVGDDERFREVRLTAETAALLPVIIDGLRLFLAETQPDKVLNRHRVGIETKTLDAPRLPPVLLHIRRMRRVPADGGRSIARHRSIARRLRRPATRSGRNEAATRRPARSRSAAALRGKRPARSIPRRPGTVLIDINRVRPVPVRFEQQAAGAGHDERGLVAQNQKSQRDGADLERGGRRLCPPLSVGRHPVSGSRLLLSAGQPFYEIFHGILPARDRPDAQGEDGALPAYTQESGTNDRKKNTNLSRLI